jgi:hypothetical protein
MKGMFKGEDLHLFLRARGWATNYDKHLNANGEDVIAIKNGIAFEIEFKRIVRNSVTGAYKMSDENIVGDICICATPSGKAFIYCNEETSLTKTVRFLEMLE